MNTPVRTDPPYVPIRSTGWATRRSPLWVLVVIVVLAVGGVLVGLSRSPSQAQRASDLRGFTGDMNYDIESCAGGVGESLSALQQVESGASRDVSTAIYIAKQRSRGKTNREAMRNLKRHLIRRIYRLLTNPNQIPITLCT